MFLTFLWFGFRCRCPRFLAKWQERREDAAAEAYYASMPCYHCGKPGACGCEESKAEDAYYKRLANEPE